MNIIGAICENFLCYSPLPRYFIGEYAGIYEVGIFSALVYLTKIGMRIVQAVGQAIIPRLAKHFAARNFRDFSRLAFGAVTVAGMFGVVGIVLSSSVGAMLLTALYGPEYAEHGETFSIIMWAGAFSYVNWLLVNILNATRTYRAQAPLAFVTISVCFAVCVLNRDLGMSGMAWAWLIAELVQLAIVGGLVFWMVRRRFFTEMVASAD